MKLFVLTLITLAIPAIAHAQNLIVNPGFESNIVTGPPVSWTTGGAINPPAVNVGNPVVPPFSGSAALDLGPSGAIFQNGGWAEQIVPISTPGSYLLSFWYRHEEVGFGTTAPFQLDLTGAGATTQNLTSTSVYQQFSQAFALGAGSLTLRFTDTQTASGVNAVVDDISLTFVSGASAPEPGTLTLLALGGILLARRRFKDET